MTNIYRIQLNELKKLIEEDDVVIEIVDAEQLLEIIVKQGNEWCVKSKKKDKKGHRKNLGCSSSRDAAERRLKQVEFFKHQGG
jgi:hypothetical protein